MPRRPGVLLLTAVATLLFVGAARRRAVEPPRPLDARRSFVVTDQAILDGFSFDRVMHAIVARSGTRTSALRLYQQLFDTQNPKPGRVATDGAHCDDFMLNGKPSFNGLPRRCPTTEGALAMTDPFAIGDHIPLAVVNRFDMAPPDGSNCGQYRVVFAKKSNSTFTRVHFIFEAVLPNPNRAAGIAGCRPVAQFWADLSKVDSMSERRAKLEAFFFDGIDGFEPVLDASHFSAASGGGIRTMHNANAPLGNRFYQFRLETRGDQWSAAPDVLQNMPYGKFFDATYDTDTARRFRDAFVANVANLAIPDQNLAFMNIPNEFLLAESNPGDSELDVVFEIPFLASQLTTEGRAFSNRIQTELRKAGSRMSPTDVVKRANQLSCTGCHFFRGNVGDLEFYQQISEAVIETGEAGPRFAISKTMRDAFVPHRIEVLTNFLRAGTAPPGASATIGGAVE